MPLNSSIADLLFHTFPASVEIACALCDLIAASLSEESFAVTLFAGALRDMSFLEAPNLCREGVAIVLLVKDAEPLVDTLFLPEAAFFKGADFDAAPPGIALVEAELLLPAADTPLSGADDLLDPALEFPFCFAHRVRCAAAIRSLPSGLIVRRFGVESAP